MTTIIISSSLIIVCDCVPTENIFCRCRYLKHTLDQYVENDYTLVYFHHGLNSSNKPTFRWLRQAYREFDRK